MSGIIYVLLVAHFVGDSAKNLPTALTAGLSGTPICALFCSGGPSDVARFVVASVVDPVERVKTRWASSNVFEKRCEVMAPVVANANPSTAVVRVLRRLWVEASGFHVRPGRVLGRVSHAVRAISISSGFVSQASARFSVSNSEVAGRGRYHRPARTSTYPLNVTTTVLFRFAEHSQAPVPTA